MNITQETEAYLKTEESEFIKYMNKQFEDADWTNQEVWDKIRYEYNKPNRRKIKLFKCKK